MHDSIHKTPTVPTTPNKNIRAFDASPEITQAQLMRHGSIEVQEEPDERARAQDMPYGSTQVEKARDENTQIQEARDKNIELLEAPNKINEAKDPPKLEAIHERIRVQQTPYDTKWSTVCQRQRRRERQPAQG